MTVTLKVVKFTYKLNIVKNWSLRNEFGQFKLSLTPSLLLKKKNGYGAFIGTVSTNCNAHVLAEKIALVFKFMSNCFESGQPVSHQVVSTHTTPQMSRQKHKSTALSEQKSANTEPPPKCYTHHQSPGSSLS